MKLSNASETIKNAVIIDAKKEEEGEVERKSYSRLSSEFSLNDKVYIRHLNKSGIIVELPTYEKNDYSVKLNETEEVILVNWFNVFFDEEKEKYSFKEKKEDA